MFLMEQSVIAARRIIRPPSRGRRSASTIASFSLSCDMRAQNVPGRQRCSAFASADQLRGGAIVVAKQTAKESLAANLVDGQAGLRTRRRSDESRFRMNVSAAMTSDRHFGPRLAWLQTGTGPRSGLRLPSRGC